MAALGALDDIKGNWAGFLIGKDKDSKWLKAYAEAQENTADQFRNCCAENTLKYARELASRLGGGFQDNDSYDWIGRLLKPIKSKEWKQARSESSKIVSITYDLYTLERDLKTKATLANIKQRSR
jgi:hypothetical protein